MKNADEVCVLCVGWNCHNAFHFRVLEFSEKNSNLTIVIFVLLNTFVFSCKLTKLAKKALGNVY